MKNLKLINIARIILAVILGEVFLVLGTTLVQEVIFNGISWQTSTLRELILGGLGTFLVAALSGIAAFTTVKKTTTIPLVILSFLVISETFWLISSGRVQGPLWFDMLGAGTLIVGFWAGSWLMGFFWKAASYSP